MHEDDDVAVLVGDVPAGGTVAIRGARGIQTLTASAALAAGHKLALRDLLNGHDVRKYGEVIGRLTKPVKRGDHVHVHNLRSLRGYVATNHQGD